MRAVKSLNKRWLRQTGHNIMEDIELQKSMDHPNLLKVFDIYEDRDCVHLVTEICTGGEMFDRVLEEQRLTEEVAAHYMK
jgi:calcium-dependent protein kinase